MLPVKSAFCINRWVVMNQKLKSRVSFLWCHCRGAAPEHSVEHCALLGGFELKRGGPLTASCLLKRGRDQGNVGPLDPWGIAGIIMHVGPLMRAQLQERQLRSESVPARRTAPLFVSFAQDAKPVVGDDGHRRRAAVRFNLLR